MDLREQRRMELAATKKIRHQAGRWIVPSQSGAGSYSVHVVSQQQGECTCPDYETRRENCKHVYAAIYVMRREENADGSTTVTEAFAVASVEKRPTYTQVWPAYNAAQTTEKDRFQSLLFDLCRGIQESRVKKNGRPTLPLADAMFSAAFKVYSTVSARRFMSDLREAQRRGFVAKTPHFNSVLNCLENPETTPILRTLITQSSLPLQSVETDFAVDSSGFMTNRFARWFDVKYGKERVQHEWVKCHLMCGVKTNVVTAVEIAGKHANDFKFLPSMVDSTAQNFAISEVSADKGYSGRGKHRRYR